MLWVSLLLICCVHAQQMKHTVQRGETFASIARKYDISEQQLRDANPYNKNLYVGIRLLIPVVGKNSSSTPFGAGKNLSASARVAQAYMDNARVYYYDGKYAKAIKEIDKALAEYNSVDAYLLRGKCYLMGDKYKKACNDFAVVMESPEATASQIQEATDLNQSSAEKWEEKANARAQFWGSLAMDALAIAQDMTQQKMLENQMVAKAGNATKDEEFNKNLQDIYRKAGKNMRKEQLNDYMSFKTMMKSTTGQDVSYAEFRRLQVEQFAAEQEANRSAALEDTVAEEEEPAEEPEKEESLDTRSSTVAKKTTVGTYGLNKTNPNVAEQKKEKLDAKQQWKKGKVSSNSFQEMKDKFVNLYSRHGNNSRLEYSHKQIYKKGGAYYVEIGSTYYKVEYSNWGAFNKMIMKGAGGNLYFNIHL